MTDIFAEDIKLGLSAKRKFIPDRDYYDDRGSVYFQELMAHPDYYVTDAEFEIFEKNKSDIIKIIASENDFNLIEFGAGDGVKTKILINELIKQGNDFEYLPIDISEKYINDLTENLKKQYSGIKINGLNMEYFDALKFIAGRNNKRNVILFIGSSFGGLNKQEAFEFLGNLYSLMKKGDMVLIGFDLKKSPELLYKAYHNTCKNWCFYLLNRINTELGGNIDLNKFEYYTMYNAIEGKFEWYFLSKAEQSIYIEKINLKVDFDLYEPVFIGQSKKFSEKEIDTLINKFNLHKIKNYYDENRYFTDFILVK